MTTLISVLIIAACILLAIVILIQNPKGGGLDSTFGSASQLGGVQKTTDFLEKATWGLMIAIVVLALATSAFKGEVQQQQDEFRDEMPVSTGVPTQAPSEAPALPEEQPAQ